MKTIAHVLEFITANLAQLDKEYKDNQFSQATTPCDRHIENVAEWEMLNKLKTYILEDAPLGGIKHD